ncbi:hypothetical protein D3C87_1791220 [compost metagenome]
MRPVSSRSRTGRALLAVWKSGVGHSSSATPVYDADSSLMAILRAPWAGSITVAQRPLMAVSTTKWLKSQCRMQGSASLPNAPSSALTGRDARPSWLATWISVASVAPLSDTGKRPRRLARLW